MRITLIGSGYIGMALARHWREQPGVHLTLTTTSEARLAELAPLADEVMLARANDPAALQAALAGAEVAVFCLAPTGDRQVDADGYRATYRDGMATLQRLLPALPLLGQIVYTGSCSVYGDAGGGWVDETTPVSPDGAHARILVESEGLLAACRSESRRVCVLRLGAIHGPGRELADRFARLAGSTRSGLGAHHCSWIHRDDVVGAVVAAVEHGWNEVVNLVDDHPCTVATLLEAVCHARGLPPVHWDGTQAEETSPADRRISNRRLHQLGYRLRHPQPVP